MAVIWKRNKIQLLVGRTQIPCNSFLFPICPDVFFLFLCKEIKITTWDVTKIYFNVEN